MRRQRTLCGIRIKSFGTPFVSAPLCGDSDLCDPDRNQSAVAGCFEHTPLCEDCDLCDQIQITANIAAWRYDVVFRGGAWSVEKVFGLVGVQYGHAQMFRLTARVVCTWFDSGGVDVRRPVWMCGYCLPFSMKTVKET